MDVLKSGIHNINYIMSATKIVLEFFLSDRDKMNNQINAYSQLQAHHLGMFNGVFVMLFNHFPFSSMSTLQLLSSALL